MSDERFARQYRYGPPPEFLLASSCTSIVRCFSGPIIHAMTQTFLRKSGPCGRVSFFWSDLLTSITFVMPSEFHTQRLARMLDSLVRVPRRVRRILVVNRIYSTSNGIDLHDLS